MDLMLLSTGLPTELLYFVQLLNMEAATPLDRAKAALRNIRGREVTQLIDLPKSNKRRHAEVSSDEDKEQPNIQPMEVRQRPSPALQRNGWRISAYGKY